MTKGQSTCAIASEVTLKAMGKIFQYQTTGKQYEVQNLYTFPGMYCDWE